MEIIDGIKVFTYKEPKVYIDKSVVCVYEDKTVTFLILSGNATYRMNIYPWEVAIIPQGKFTNKELALLFAKALKYGSTAKELDLLRTVYRNYVAWAESGDYKKQHDFADAVEEYEKYIKEKNQ